MKNLSLLLMFLTASTFVFTSCSKDDEDNRKKLEIHVGTQNSQPIENATVKIYRRYNDYLEGTNQIGETQITNKDGVATFFDLPNGEYQCIIEKGCLKNNLNNFTHYYPVGTYLNYSTDVPNRSFVVYETGIVHLLSNSYKFHSLYLDGEYVSYSLLPHSINRLILPTGKDFNIKVVSNDFKSKSMDVNLSCGQNETLSFPN